MKSILSIIVVVLAGVAGLAFVFRDLPVQPGPGLIALGGLFYVVVGYALTKIHAGRRHLMWAVAPGWGLIVLGLVGLWVTLTDPPSGHLSLAMLFLLGPPAAGLIGASLARRGTRD